MARLIHTDNDYLYTIENSPTWLVVSIFAVIVSGFEIGCQ